MYPPIKRDECRGGSDDGSDVTHEAHASKYYRETVSSSSRAS
jgi:hypothetical protein